MVPIWSVWSWLRCFYWARWWVLATWVGLRPREGRRKDDSNFDVSWVDSWRSPVCARPRWTSDTPQSPFYSDLTRDHAEWGRRGLRGGGLSMGTAGRSNHVSLHSGRGSGGSLRWPGTAASV